MKGMGENTIATTVYKLKNRWMNDHGARRPRKAESCPGSGEEPKNNSTYTLRPLKALEMTALVPWEIGVKIG